jgi:UDP-glucuronate decarboxylase
MTKSTKRILIAGGAGFIGSNLAHKLHAQGHYVFCLDNFSTGRKENLSPLNGQERFELIEADVEDQLNLQVEEIYNLASPASPPHYQKDPIKTSTTNVLGTLNLLGLAKKTGAKFLLASTSEIYGDPKEHPQTETYRGNVNPTGIRSCYDESKRMAETLTMDFYRQYGVKVKIVRIFNTFGPNMDPDDGRVVSNFIVQALKNQPLTIYGSGNQTRSFQYVDDLIEGLIKLMESPDNFTGPVNLGNPEEFTVNSLADEVLILIPESTGQKIYKPLPEDDPTKRKPDIRLAKEKLNWEPKVKLNEGLIKTIEYFKHNLNIEK